MEQQRMPDTTRPGLPDDVFHENLTARAAVDEGGMVTGWSDGARRLLGYAPDEIVGRPAACLLDEDVPAETLRGIQSLPRWNGRVPMRHRDGHRVEAGLPAHRRTGEDQGPYWFLVCALTGTATTPEDETLAEWSFEQSPCCAMQLYDTRLRLRGANHYLERALNLTEAEMRGLRLPEIVPRTENEKNERHMIRVLETGKPQYRREPASTPGRSTCRRCGTRSVPCAA
jgi:PAS domain S-box-containing protein